MKKYYILSSSEAPFFSDLLNNTDIFQPVKTAQVGSWGMGIFSFNNNGIDFLTEIFKLSHGSDYIFDTDGNKYIVDNNGVSKQTDSDKRYTLKLLKKVMRKNLRVVRYSTHIHKRDKKKTQKLNKDTILSCGKALWYPSFKRLKFYNLADGKCHRFRLHIPKRKDNNALILFLHGAGALGYDNFQQIWETRVPYNHLKKAKKDCFILAPQLGYTDLYNTDKHSEMLWNMINAVNEKYGKIDFSRIYILGVSYGGHCTIYECFRHSERYAAAIPTVAWTYIEGERQYGFCEDKYHLPFDEEGIAELAKTPMWLACSHIEARYVESLHRSLSDVGAQVHLTRNDKHGHSMWNDFFKEEPWEKWLFDKTKNA